MRAKGSAPAEVMGEDFLRKGIGEGASGSKPSCARLTFKNTEPLGRNAPAEAFTSCISARRLARKT